MERDFKPITVKELIQQLEFVRDQCDAGDFEIRLCGSSINKDGKVYGASAEFDLEESYAYLVVSDEYKGTST